MILEYILLATGGKRQNKIINGGLTPLVFMTDSDPAVDAACIRVYKNCYAIVYYRCEHFELNQINMFEQEISTRFLEDLPDERKACAKSILHHVNQEEIKEIWGVSVQNTQKFKHFILLMNNSAHLYSCLATVTKEILYLTTMIQNNVDKWNQESKSNLDERIFYGKYLNEFDDENGSLENDLDDEIEADEIEENDNLQLQNPIKKPKKGRA
ncbi:hypothetical protein C1645_876175 [Glomus cerebriforme]|uniref:Uncharacterized protein n=1 Tax=Glomus cerebriforme TaxID=658196 RepID=A0A397SVT7_9GLOM|nr:hypothetical protein C1645_876175 [Glomus cerebriforme]